MRRLSIGLLTFAAAQTAQAVPQPELNAVGGAQARALLGKGSGVIIGILDGGIDPNHPAIRGSILAARDFSRSGTTDDEPGIGHSTGIASLFIGHATDFTGLVPQAKLVNARVITKDDSTSDRMAGDGLYYSVNLGAKVINLSLGNRLGDGPLTNKFNLMVDYVAEQYGASIVSAAGNDEETAVAQVPAGAFNGYSIGSLSPKFDRVSSFSNFAVASDKRTKPDLVAPGESIERASGSWETSADYATGSGTSFSTPIVGGVLAQMIGYGKSHGLPTDPRLLKAITMTSADKVRDFDGQPWAPRREGENRAGILVIDQPLDDEQGAGRIDAVAAYQLYTRTHDAATPVNAWDLTSLKRGQHITMNLGRLSKGERIDSSVVWNRHVTRTDNGNGVADSGDGYAQTVPLANFVLRLLKNGNEIARSDSLVDNFEHLSIPLRRSGSFSVEVIRATSGGMKNESFAFASRVLGHPPVLAAAADTPAMTPGESSRGVSRGIEERGSVETTVPEPSGVVVLGILSGWGLARRRRRAS